MAYLTEREVEKLETEILDGSWDKPFFKDIPEWECVAKYFGYSLKWDKTPVDQWTPRGRELRYYCYPKYKKGYDRFEFWDIDVDQIYDVYKKLQEDGLYDEDLQRAWTSLNKETMLKVLYVKLNFILNS
jgi:hypothetical protein